MSVLIVTPTYNELENIRKLVPAALSSLPDAHILVVDDNSPDGTGALVDELAKADPRVHVLHRTEKNGLGRAYIAGMTWGLSQGYDKIVMMDADLSHDPKYLPQLVAGSETHDLAIGSRYVHGGGTKNWGLHRKVLSRGANLYIRTILGLDTNDMTGGFRCWNRRVLEDINLPSIRSNGYSFIVETLYRARLRGFTAKEVPIIFVDRVDGQSKMDRKVIMESISMVLKLRINEMRAKTRTAA